MPTATAGFVPTLSRDEIEQRATHVLNSHGLNSIPVSPLTLAKRLGMDVRNATFDDETTVGAIAKTGDEVLLLVNADDPPFRKRFTIAHELAHFVLHLPADGEFVDGEANLFRGGENQADLSPELRQEIQANLFAVALLMPAAAVRAEWQKLGSIRKMARRFDVSGAAMGARVAQLGLA